MLKEILSGFFKNHHGQISVDIQRSGALLTVYLSVNDRRRAHMQCVVESDSDILIGDIRHYSEPWDYNKGYGTLMMQTLLGYATENGFQCIRGNLAEVDLDHKDRLHHFYQKFGFSVIEFSELQENYYGVIELHF